MNGGYYSWTSHGIIPLITRAVLAPITMPEASLAQWYDREYRCIAAHVLSSCPYRVACTYYDMLENHAVFVYREAKGGRRQMTMPSGPFAVRPLYAAAELRQCQDVQRRAWGIAEDGYLVPVATLAAVAAYGGLVLGALEGERVIGFSFAFRGVIDGTTPCLYSQLTGVLPEAQGGGVGRRIKAAQRQWAREQGLPLIVWAFDPLQSLNAHYNLRVLGARVMHYHPDFYGPREDALNPGLPTDRLIAIWPTTELTPPAATPPEDATIKLFLSRTIDDDPPEPELRAWEPYRCVGIEIPPDLGAMRHVPGLPARWQAAVRTAFTRAFAEGYEGVSFVKGDGYAFYVLIPKER